MSLLHISSTKYSNSLRLCQDLDVLGIIDLMFDLLPCITNLEFIIVLSGQILTNGGVAQMVERSLSMREVPGSIPGASKIFLSVW